MIRNLNELETVIDSETIEKCFLEYFLTIAGKAKRLDDLETGQAVMDEDETEAFLSEISKKIKPTENNIFIVHTVLIALGYKRQWASKLRW